MNHRTLILMLPLVAFPLAVGGQQPAPRDFELARSAVERGEIVSLSKVLEAIEREYPGKVVDVELEYDADGIEYEIEIVTDDGRLIEIDVDAVTGRILEVDVKDK